MRGVAQKGHAGNTGPAVLYRQRVDNAGDGACVAARDQRRQRGCPTVEFGCDAADSGRAVAKVDGVDPCQWRCRAM